MLSTAHAANPPAGLPLPGHDWIAAHIPHQGRMCLLDAVLECTPERIVCSAHSHTAPDHPLRAAGRLGVAAGIEYAAQAMAVHGALLAQQAAPHGQGAAAPPQGYLASVRGVRMHALSLDGALGALRVQAERVSGDAQVLLYHFTVGHGAHCLLEGRASVVIDAEAGKEHR